MNALSPEFRRVLAVLLLLLALAGGNELVVQPLLDLHRQLDTGWQEASLRLAHYQRAAARLEALEERRSQFEIAAAGPLPYITAESDSLVIAALQEAVRQTVESNGAELIGTRVLDGVSQEGFRRLGMRVTLAAALAPLQATLYALEAGATVHLIDDLSIQRRYDNTATAVADADPLLDVAFDIVVYRRESSS
jgi:hypothetical protein